MISIEDLIKAGQIQKPHGVKGELNFSFQIDVSETCKSDWLMVMVGGLPVPVRVEHIRIKTSGEAILKIESIDTAAQAAGFAGCEVYVSKDKYSATQPVEDLLSRLVGYVVIDQEAGVIGTITQIDESTQNVLFVVDGKVKQVLIPVTKAFILEIDHDSQRIVTSLPEGLLSL